MKHKYPKYNGRSLIKTYGGQRCKCCNEKAIAKVEIQTNWFRGDDEYFWVCEPHLQMAKNEEFDQFYKNAT